MATITEIEAKILELDGGSYQDLMNAYLYAKYRWSNILKLGSQVGSTKPTKGIPDAYIKINASQYIYIMYGTVRSGNPFDKLKKDILSVINNTKSNIPYENISKLICCHTSSNLTPEQDAALHSLTDKLELIGINTVASDLFYFYQFLASSYLGLAIDTNQILSLEEFVKRYNEKEVTSLNFPMLGREKEKKEIMRLLKSNDVIVITGPSGIGKTKLAIEVAKEFSKKNSYTLKALLNKGESLYKDISSHFPDNDNFLIVLDDANLISQIDLFLDLVRSTDRQHNTKLILTVRDYAVPNLSPKITFPIRLASFHVKPLDKSITDRIIETNFNISNPVLLDKIFHMTHHNIRLAIMAAQYVHRREWDKIEDASELFALHYKNVFQSLSLETIKIATIIAFFEKVSLYNNELLMEMLATLSISKDHFSQTIKDLYEKEIINLLHEVAVKFADQTLRDYLLYRYLVVAPIIPLEKLLELALPQYTQNVVAIYNVVGNIFRKQQYIDSLNVALRTYWNSHHTLSIEEKKSFLEAFHIALPTETLDFASEIFKNTQSSEVSHELIVSLLNMLVHFKNSKYVEDALSLILSYLQLPTADVSLVCKLFTDYLYIDEYSHALKYRQEALILDIIYHEFYSSRNTNVGMLLVSFAETCLQTQNTIHSIEGRNIVLKTIHLQHCKESINLRKLAFKCLKYAFHYSQLKTKVRESIFKQALIGKKSLFQKTDKESLINFSSKLNLHCFDDALLLGILDIRGKKYHLYKIDLFKEYLQNKYVQVFLELSGYYRRDLTNYQKAHKSLLKRLKRLTKTFTQRDYKSFLKILLNSKLALQINPNILNQGISTLFESQEDPAHFEIMFRSYAEIHEKLPGVDLPYIFCSAITKFNKEFIYQLISKFRSNKREIFLSALYICIPITDLQKAEINQILKVPMQKKNNSSCYLLSIQRIIEINKQFPSFLYRYIKTVYDLFPKDYSIFASIFSHISALKERELTSLVNALMPSNDTVMLPKIYLLLAFSNPNNWFDYHGRLFNAIYQQDKRFTDVIIQETLINYQTMRLLETCDVIWKLQEYRSIINSLIHSLYQQETNSVKIVFALQHMIFPIGTHRLQEQRKDFINWYISHYAKNMQRMKDLFEAMQGQCLAQRIDFLFEFCKENTDFESFQEITLRVTSRMWSGSLLPTLDADIQALEQLKKRLTGSKYYKHRARLQKAIDSLINERKEVEVREFLEIF